MSDFGIALLDTFRAKAQAGTFANMGSVAAGTPAGNAIIEFGRTLEPWLSRYTAGGDGPSLPLTVHTTAGVVLSAASAGPA